MIKFNIKSKIGNFFYKKVKKKMDENPDQIITDLDIHDLKVNLKANGKTHININIDCDVDLYKLIVMAKEMEPE